MSSLPSDSEAMSRLLAVEEAAADTLFAVQRRMSDVSLALAGEAFDFAARRLRAQVAFMEALRACTDPQSVLEAQFRFAATTAQDYVAEMAALARTAQPAEARMSADAEKPTRSVGQATTRQAAE